MEMGGESFHSLDTEYNLRMPCVYKFWSTSIADGLVQLLGLLYLRESNLFLCCYMRLARSILELIFLAFAPLLLEWKARRLQKSADPEKSGTRQYRTIYDGAHRK